MRETCACTVGLEPELLKLVFYNTLFTDPQGELKNSQGHHIDFIHAAWLA